MPLDATGWAIAVSVLDMGACRRKFRDCLSVKEDGTTKWSRLAEGF